MRWMIGLSYIVVNGMENWNAGKGQFVMLKEHDFQNNRVQKQYDQQHDFQGIYMMRQDNADSRRGV